jgi:hypothetical protein
MGATLLMIRGDVAGAWVMGVDGVVDETESRPRFRGLGFVRPERHLDRSRVVFAGLGFLLAISLALYLGKEALRSSVHWLHHQPQYQLPFLEIELKEAPPAWFRGGSLAFLRKVRETSREVDLVSLMELEEGQIERDFKLFPWVDSVRRVEYPPGGIRVDLAYKTPVAVIPYPRGEQVILDHNGHILSSEDIDPEKLGPLIQIRGTLETPLVPSTENRPGRIWRSEASDNALATRLERGVTGAARLAGELKVAGRTEAAALHRPLHILAIIAADKRGLWLQNVEDTMFYWGEPQDEQDFKSSADEEKWEALLRWAKGSSSHTLPPGDYWAFSRSEKSNWELKPVHTLRDRVK